MSAKRDGRGRKPSDKSVRAKVERYFEKAGLDSLANPAAKIRKAIRITGEMSEAGVNAVISTVRSRLLREAGMRRGKASPGRISEEAREKLVAKLAGRKTTKRAKVAKPEAEVAAA